MSGADGLFLAIIIFALVIIVIWGRVEAARDREKAARHIRYMHEVRNPTREEEDLQ